MNHLTPIAIEGLRSRSKTRVVTVTGRELADTLCGVLLLKLRPFRPDIYVRQDEHEASRLTPPTRFDVWVKLQEGRFGPAWAERIDAYISGILAGWHHAMAQQQAYEKHVAAGGKGSAA